MTFDPRDFAGVTFDSRQVKPGFLYAALPGTKADGHSFVKAAFAAGAKGLLVRQDRAAEFVGPEKAALIPVADVKQALTDTAREYRQVLKATVVGITGSAGKTTTKEFTAAFLRQLGKTHATSGNFNNDLGLPITILNAPGDTEYLITEMGTNHPGEIAHLVSIAKPDAGIIASIGTAHIEFFGTQDGIAEEKGTLFRALPPDGFAVVGKNNSRYEKLAGMCKCRVLGVEGNAPFECPLPGEHNASNMALAWACAEELWRRKTAASLNAFSLPGERWKKSQKGGVSYISDCYNANPTSMLAALETFAKEKVGGRKIVVLGDMFELGAKSEELHAMVKAKAAALGFDKVIYAGERFGGGTVAAAGRELAEYAKAGDCVLLKASHGMQLGVLAK